MNGVRNQARPGLASRTATPGSAVFVAVGTGLQLAAPKVPTSFIVSSSNGSKLRIADLKLTLKGAAKVDHEIKERRDGSLLVKYISHMSGDVIITLAYGRSTIEGSPFKARCAPPKAEAANSTCALSQQNAFVEETVKATVRTFDQFGDACTAGSDISAQVLEAATGAPLFDAHVVETAGGEYEVSFVPEMAGMYALNVLLSGVPVQGCPLRMKVLADETLANNCRCFGPGMSQSVAGVATSFTIQAIDGRGVARKSGGDNFEISIRGPEGDCPHATIRDNAEGTYTVSWTGNHSGLYAVTVSIEGINVAGCPFNCNVQPTTISAEACTAQPASIARIRAGERSEFRIVARDGFGNVRHSGGDEFSVVLKMVEGPGKAEVHANVSDESKGMYKASFKAQHTGVYQVHVLADGTPIKGSPFRSEVSSGRPDFTKCKLGGPGLEAVRLGQPCDLLIELFDTFSNKITSALDALADIQVSVDGPSRVTVSPAGMKHGSACFQYVAMHAGAYTVTATIEGRHINNSPATVNASIAKPHAPLCEVLTDTKALKVCAGAETTIIFVAKDKAGIRKSVGGDIFMVSWRSLDDKRSSPSAARVTDLGTGEYTTTFTESAAGAFQVSIGYEDRHIAGSPLTAHVSPAGLEPAKTTASGVGLSQCIATQPATVQVFARDLFGNSVVEALKTGPGEIEAVLRGPETIELKADKSEAGCASLSYTCTKTGPYDLSITHGGRHIAGSPWKVSAFPGPAIASMCSVQGLPASVVAGAPFSFSLHTVDECGNPTVSTNTVTAELDSPADGVVPLLVSEGTDGVYHISGALKGAASAVLRLLVNGQQLPNLPNLKVVPAEAAAIHWSSGSMVSHGASVVAGEEGHASLACCDAYGNRITTAVQGVAAHLKHEGGSGEHIQGEGQVVSCRSSPMPDGTVRVFFRPERTGAYQLTAALEGTTRTPPITATVTCTPGRKDMTRSMITRSDVRLVAGHPGCAMVDCADIFGNSTSNVPSVPVTVAPSGPGKMSVWWERTPKTAQLAIYYSCTVVGDYTLTLTAPQGGASLGGSPLKISVDADTPCAARCSASASSNGKALSAGSATLMAGSPIHVNVALADVYGNPVSGSTAVAGLEVIARAASGAPFTFQMAPSNGKGTVFQAIAERAGLFSVQVRVAGTLLPGWHLPICVTPGKPAATNCRLHMLSHSAIAVIARPVSCLLSTADIYDNTRHVGGATVSPVVVRPDGEESNRALVKDLSDGQYLITFTPDEAGEWAIGAMVDGEEISPDHELQINVAVPSLTVDMCSVYVPEEARTVAAGSSFYVTVGPPESTDFLPPADCECLVHLTAPDNSVAVYTATWDTGQVAFVADLFVGAIGGHLIWATLNGTRVGAMGGSIPVQSVPNCIELNASDLVGAGLASCLAGEQAEVALLPRDALGNAGASITASTGGSLSVSVVIEDAVGETQTVTMKADPSKAGALKATYVVKKAGPVKLAVQLMEPDGTVIQQRSFAGICRPGKPSPAHFELKWNQEPLTAGVHTQLQVVCMDAYQNLLQMLPGNELWSAFLQQGSSQVGSVEVQPMTDSRYGFSIRCDSAGPTSLFLTFGGTPLFSGAIAVTVQSACMDVAKCTAEFVGTASTAFTAGETTSVKSILRDALGNVVPVTTAEALQVSLAPGRSDSVIFNSQSAGWRNFMSNGTVAHLAVEDAGTYIVHAHVGEHSLPGWPRVISVVAARADPKRSSVSCANPGQVLVCGSKSSLTLVTRDKSGNRCIKGGARVEVAARALGSVLPGQVTDHGDGTYSLSLVLDVEGEWEMSAAIDGISVSGMPRRMVAAYPPLTAKDCELLASELATPLIAGTGSRICVQAKGVQKTRRAFTGAEAISVIVTDACGHSVHTPVALEAGGLRSAAIITPLLPGSVTVSVLLGGKHLAGSPVEATVLPAVMSPLHCSVTPMTQDIAASYKLDLPPATLLVVSGNDSLGNATELSQDDLALTFTPPSAVSEITLHTLPDGAVAVCGAVKREAEALVSVQGTRLTLAPVKLRPGNVPTQKTISRDGALPGAGGALARGLGTSGTSDTARLRVLQAPDNGLTVGEEFDMVVQCCDASGTMFDLPGLTVEARLTLKVIRGAAAMAGVGSISMRGSDATRSFHDGESVGGDEGTPRGTATGDDMPQVSPLMGLGTTAAYNNSARSVPVTVTSLGSGMFALAATPDKAGTYVMRASVDSIHNDAGAFQLPLEVRAGTMAPERCEFVADSRTCNAWLAGRTARLMVHLHDAYLNPVHDVDVSQLDVDVQGPGSVTHSLAYGPGGRSSVEIRLTGRAAGTYEVTVRDRTSGKLLGGPAIELVMKPGAINPQLSSFHVRGLQLKGNLAAMLAGSSIDIAPTVFDAFGNAGALAGGEIVVHACGPDGVKSFRPKLDASIKAGTGALSVFVPLTLTRAGTYRLSVEVTDAEKRVLKLPAAPGHDVLQVKPGVTSPAQTIIESWPSPETPLPTGAPHALIIVPCDAYSNPGASSGSFIVRLAYPKGSGTDPTVASISPSNNARGDIVATLVPRAIGTPQLQVICTPMRAPDAAAPASAVLVATRDVRVVEAPTSASECFLSGVWPTQGCMIGQPCGMSLTACDAYGNPRRSGGDRFTTEIPGLARGAVTTLDRGDGSYTIEFVPLHEGSISVHVLLDGAHIRASPMSLSVHRDIDALARSALTGKLSTAVTGLRRGLANARTMQAALRADAEQLQQYVPVLVNSAASDMQSLLRERERLLQDARAAVTREGSERRRLHNLVQELRGNIRVYVRVKPLTANESGSGIRSVIHCPSDNRIECNTGTSTKAFDFDRVFGDTCTQQEVYAEVGSLVTSALDGYNVCIFAYGQTGSGKTHTMEGPHGDPGVSFRAMEDLFRVIDTERHTDHKHVITASIVEIYNEQVRDLLGEDPLALLELRGTAAGNGFFVPNLVKIPVTSADQIHSVMSQGYTSRVTACHNINEHSSRSHALLIVEVAATNLSSGIRTLGKLTLCDLAGSERVNKTGASGMTLLEAQNINLSLLELGNVMSALMTSSSHVPYRNSKLTMLLQDSLGGDAKALMFCNLAPQPAHVSETLSSLAFASKVSSVVLKTPGRRVEEAPAGESDSAHSLEAVTPGAGGPPQTPPFSRNMSSSAGMASPAPRRGATGNR